MVMVMMPLVMEEGPDWGTPRQVVVDLLGVGRGREWEGPHLGVLEPLLGVGVGP